MFTSQNHHILCKRIFQWQQGMLRLKEIFWFCGEIWQWSRESIPVWHFHPITEVNWQRKSPINIKKVIPIMDWITRCSTSKKNPIQTAPLITITIKYQQTMAYWDLTDNRDTEKNDKTNNKIGINYLVMQIPSRQVVLEEAVGWGVVIWHDG